MMGEDFFLEPIPAHQVVSCFSCCGTFSNHPMLTVVCLSLMIFLATPDCGVTIFAFAWIPHELCLYIHLRLGYNGSLYCPHTTDTRPIMFVSQTNNNE